MSFHQYLQSDTPGFILVFSFSTLEFPVHTCSGEALITPLITCRLPGRRLLNAGLVMHPPAGHSSTLTFRAGSCLRLHPKSSIVLGAFKGQMGNTELSWLFRGCLFPSDSLQLLPYFSHLLPWSQSGPWHTMKTLSSKISASLTQEPSVPCFFPAPPHPENMHRPLTTLNDTHLGALSFPFPVCFANVGCLSRGQRRASLRPDSKPYMLQHGVYLLIAASFQ